MRYLHANRRAKRIHMVIIIIYSLSILVCCSTRLGFIRSPKMPRYEPLLKLNTRNHQPFLHCLEIVEVAAMVRLEEAKSGQAEPLSDVWCVREEHSRVYLHHATPSLRQACQPNRPKVVMEG